MLVPSFIKKYKAVALLLALAGPVLPQAQPGKAYETTVNGVKVIVQPGGNEIVEVLTVLKGGVQNYPPAEAGIESLALTALSECGTANDSKNSFKDKLDKVSAEVGSSTTTDYSTFRLNCIKGDLGTVWPLYVDAITRPLFDSNEFNRIKQDAVNQLRAKTSRPDYAIDKLARETAYPGKDIAQDPDGTVESVMQLTAAQAKAYYASVLTRSRLLVVVVGDVERPVIEQMVKSLTDPIPEGKAVVLRRYMYKPAKNTFTQEKKEVATNYIEAITGGPEPGSPDFEAFTLAMRIFYNRHFLEVRTNNGLSYAPQTRFSPGLTSTAVIKVSTTDPNKYKMVADQVIGKIKKDGFTPDEVKDGKNVYVTSFYYQQETNSAQANTLAVNEVLFNNWKRALDINELYQKVTLPEVNAAFKKYINQLTWVYQGDSAKVNPALYTGAAERMGSRVEKGKKK